MNATDSRIPAAHILWLVAGFTVWSSGFVLVYGVHALGCRAGWTGMEIGPMTVQRAVLLAIWATHIAAGLALFAPLNALAGSWTGPAGDFLRRAAILVTLAAAGASVWTGAPLSFLAACV